MTDLDTLTVDDLAEITDAIPILDNDQATQTDWLTARRSYIGGSDAAGILGVSRWATPRSIWLDKTGRTPIDDNSSVRLRAGHHLEPFVLTEAMEKEPGLSIVRAPYMLRHPSEDRSMLAVNLDGIAWAEDRSDPGIAEAKTSERFMEADWAEGPPLYYRAQVAHAAAVTGLRWAVIAVMHGLGTVDVHRFELDPDVVESVASAGKAWWETHVVADDPPPVDAHPATTAALKELPFVPGSVRELDATEEEEVRGLMQQIASARTTQERAEGIEEKAKNRLRELIGDAGELLGPSGDRWATWKRSKDSEKTAWKAIAQALGEQLDDPDVLDDLITKHTTTKPGNRPLLVTAGINRIKKEGTQ